MKFESVCGAYEVINLLYETSLYEVYRCLRGKKYIVCRITDEKLKKASCQVFLEMRRTDFDGINDIFTDRDSLIIVFPDNSLSETARDYSDESTAGTEKIRFFEKALTALCVHSVPIDIACDLLAHDNVGVTVGGEAECRYEPLEIERYGGSDMKRLAEIFAEKFSAAFSRAYQTKLAEEISLFCAELTKKTPESILGLYGRYSRFAETLAEKYENKAPKERIIRFAKSAAAAGRIALTAIALGLALLALALAFIGERPKEGGIYPTIGNVVIEEYSSQQRRR